MNHWILLALFVSLWIVTFAGFGMQRATVLMARQAGVPPQISKLLLPRWFPALWLAIVAKWVLVLAVAIGWSWIVAVVLLLLDFASSAMAPIQYDAYLPTFRKRAAQITLSNQELGTAITAMVENWNPREC